MNLAFGPSSVYVCFTHKGASISPIKKYDINSVVNILHNSIPNIEIQVTDLPKTEIQQFKYNTNQIYDSIR